MEERDVGVEPRGVSGTGGSIPETTRDSSVYTDGTSRLTRKGVYTKRTPLVPVPLSFPPQDRRRTGVGSEVTGI